MKNLFEAVKQSRNKIIQDAWLDFLEFNEKTERTELKLVEQIKYSIYVAKCDYDDWGNSADYSIQCINSAKNFLKKYIGD